MVIKLKDNGQSVPKIEWKQTDGQADGRMNGGECITSPTNAVGYIPCVCVLVLQ